MVQVRLLGFFGLLFLLIFSAVWASRLTASPKVEVQEPAIITREGWGARPPSGSYTPHTPNKITVHHTATSNDYTNSTAVVQSIQNYHMDVKGWIDIGYHYLIDKWGNIFQGRPDDVVGAHVAGYNTGNIGVSAIGSYHLVDVPPALQTALENLLAWLCYKYNISPDTIKGHRDYAATECPGEYLYARLPAIRTKVQEMLNPPADTAVGGIWIPSNKFVLLAPYIGLASTILVATVAIAIYAMRVKRRKEKRKGWLWRN